MIDKDLLNEIWFLIAENQNIKLEDLANKINVDPTKIQKILNILIANEIIQFKEKEKTFLLNKYTPELYAKSIMINLNVIYLDKFVKLNNEELKKVSQIILSTVSKNKKEQKEENSNKKIIENLKSSNWLLILNDIKKVLNNYKEDEEKTDEYNILLSLKNEFDKNLQEYFQGKK